MVRQNYELKIPVGLVEQALSELPVGVRMTIDSSVLLWRSKRITADEFESLLNSVAWQSQTLKEYFDGVSGKNAEAEAFEGLSEDDMLSLFADSGNGPAKKPCVSDEYCLIPARKQITERRPAKSGPKSSSHFSEMEMEMRLKKSGSINNFDDLSMAESDSILDDVESEGARFPMSSIEDVFTPFRFRDKTLIQNQQTDHELGF